jgi:hypothetical protein
LAHHCLDLPFKRPSARDAKKRVLKIAQMEGIGGDELAIEKILESVHGGK